MRNKKFTNCQAMNRMERSWCFVPGEYWTIGGCLPGIFVTVSTYIRHRFVLLIHDELLGMTMITHSELQITKLCVVLSRTV